MKIEELKHNHSLTDLLKILLFAILMLAPIGSVATRSLYVICNKNAYQSYSGYNIETNTELATSIESGLDYQLSYMSYSGTMTSDTAFSINNLVVASSYTSLQNFYNTYKEDIEYLRFGVASNVYRVYFYRDDMSLIDHYSLSIGQPTTITFTATSNTTLNNNDLVYRIYQQQVGNSLDNVFEYSVSQLEESNLFNWTENTAIYSGINAMNVQLGINSPAITITLTYWLILTCIYVIIDIVLKLFTYITHMIGNRKA